jgi:hypothetical protein
VSLSHSTYGRATAPRPIPKSAPVVVGVTELSPPAGGRPRSLGIPVTKGLLPAVLQAEIGGSAPDKPAGQRSCKKCHRSDRRFSGRHTLCNHCRTVAPTPRFCECGAPLGPRQHKCDTCLLTNHPAASQCPFCFKWYWTHRGMGLDLSEIRYHAQARCIKQAPAGGAS